MPDIPHRRIKQHRRCLKDVETPFIAKKWRQSFQRLKVFNSKSDVPNVFKEAVYAANKDQKHTQAENSKGCLGVPAVDVGVDTVAVE